jgi:hypothetical protein
MTTVAEHAVMDIVGDCAVIIARVRWLAKDKVLSDQAVEGITLHLLAVARACMRVTVH